VNAVQTQVEVGSTVYVQGTVGDRIPLVDGQVYALEDTTGYIWVVTSDSTLTTGEDVLIKGTLSYQATPEFGADEGERYLWEVGQIERSP
jgi:outer membrane protein assembly factor BamB